MDHTHHVEGRNITIVECRDYKSLNDFLIRIDYSHEIVRAVCTGVPGPLPYQDVVTVQPGHRSVVAKEHVRLFLQEISVNYSEFGKLNVASKAHEFVSKTCNCCSHKSQL